MPMDTGILIDSLKPKSIADRFKRCNSPERAHSFIVLVSVAAIAGLQHYCGLHRHADAGERLDHDMRLDPPCALCGD